jgi:hypothetical protein
MCREVGKSFVKPARHGALSLTVDLSSTSAFISNVSYKCGWRGVTCDRRAGPLTDIATVRAVSIDPGPYVLAVHPTISDEPYYCLSSMQICP